MNLHITRNKAYTTLYMAETFRKGKATSSRIVEKLGTMSEIMEKHNFTSEEQAIEWAKQYIAEKTALQKKDVELNIKVMLNKLRKPNETLKYHFGYIFLEKVYYDLGLNLIFGEIQKRYKITYDLNHIVESLVYGRIISPASKLRTSEDVEDYFNWSPIQTHQVYRSLSLLAKEEIFVQSNLFKLSKQVYKRDTGVIYYDCTNFFCEVEEASGLRQYGYSKEHRPNPIIQFGMFIDYTGIPISYVIDSGDTGESTMMCPLEKEMEKEFNFSKFVVCTDAGMSSGTNKLYNSKADRHFVTVQSVKKLKKPYKDWALSSNGWSIFVVNAKDDTEEERKEKEYRRKLKFNLEELDEQKYYDTIFFKQIQYDQDFKEEGDNITLSQTLIVTYSIKYKQYQEKNRLEQIKRAEVLINRGDATINKKDSRDCKRFIAKTYTTEEGELANKCSYHINTQQIEDESIYDGLYAVTTDVKTDIYDVITVNKNRWMIEDGFRIMKTYLRSRPIYLSKDERIRSHFLICFISLVICRIIEKIIMNDKYTIENILTTIRDMTLTKFSTGFIPTFKTTDCSHALQVKTQTFADYEFIPIEKMIKLVKQNKKNSINVKREFNKNVVATATTSKKNYNKKTK